MSITAGAISLVSKTQDAISLSASVATGGTAPYSYQWYRSLVANFTPGGGNILAGKTGLALTDSGLIPGTQYYYSVIATDSAGSPATIAYTNFGAQTANPVPNISSFAMTSQLAMIDLRFDGNTVAAQIDASQATGLAAGAAVKLVDSADGVPKVVGVVANTDEVFGFINYDIKSKLYFAGAACEVSLGGNCIYLYATGAIARGAQVQLDVTTNGGVAQKVGSSGANIVGWAYDKAPAAGALIRVMLTSPSYAFA